MLTCPICEQSFQKNECLICSIQRQIVPLQNLFKGHWVLTHTQDNKIEKKLSKLVGVNPKVLKDATSAWKL